MVKYNLQIYCTLTKISAKLDASLDHPVLLPQIRIGHKSQRKRGLKLTETLQNYNTVQTLFVAHIPNVQAAQRVVQKECFLQEQNKRFVVIVCSLALALRTLPNCHRC